MGFSSHFFLLLTGRMVSIRYPVFSQLGATFFLILSVKDLFSKGMLIP